MAAVFDTCAGRRPNRRLPPVRAELEARHEIAMRVVSVGKYRQQRVVPLRSPDPSIFTAAEIAAADKIVDGFWNHTATQVSEFSHGIAWNVAENKASIPYEAAFLSDESLTDYDRVRTAELASERGWKRTAHGSTKRRDPLPRTAATQYRPVDKPTPTRRRPMRAGSSRRS